ncbi:NADH-quinone oxidoreductase subunit L [Candidatus Fukatsuia anoeciicola]|uniref:NADH-quinone oxidoreductase subunit L n=1 Tax=Candidatus Fukatsuia anoeciicola TaxID=2994492 RepID=UPI003463D533
MNLLFLTILLPLLGFLLLAFSAGRYLENISAFIGVGSIGLTTLVTFYIAINFLSQQAVGIQVFNQTLWHWIIVDNFSIPLTLRLDNLSLILLSVVIGVGFFIHLYASWYMRTKEGYSRFFAYTNLFIASMVVLVLADNLLILYLGWEGVGLCSYLLIGFYYSNPISGSAAIKAFIVTRIGDVFLAFALFILYKELGTLNIHELIILAPQKLAIGSNVITWATLMLLGGAVGKSAQLPLQTWLADAMAGPTPVSALIHAATMVTAGVYLIARTYSLFLMAPEVLYLVGIIGAVTLLLAGFAALVQTNIKHVLAYSTMSQIGYMFLALGVQAWHAAIFHLMIHAFFKALLFLASGSVIITCHHQQNIFKMGGLLKIIPLVYICFLVGGASLAALPIITAGFYSKDEILWGVLASGHINLLIVGLIGTFLTALYTFRMIFIVFHGKAAFNVSKYIQPVQGISHSLPLLVLLVLSTFIGALIKLPLTSVLPENYIAKSDKIALEVFSSVLVISGIALASLLYLGKRQIVSNIAQSVSRKFMIFCWFYAWSFDWLYNKLFVQPYLWIAKILQRDPLDLFMNFFASFAYLANYALSFSENGKIRWYLASMGLGAVIVLLILLFI